MEHARRYHEHMIGIDYATRHVALSWLGEHTRVLKINTPISQRPYELAQLRWGLNQEMSDCFYYGCRFVVEEPVLAGAKNLQTTIKLAQTNGMILAALALPGMDVLTVPVSSWKKATVGKGNATKGDVGTWLKAVHPSYSALCDGDQDLVDATCIALYGLGVSDARTALGRHNDSPGTA